MKQLLIILSTFFLLSCSRSVTPFLNRGAPEPQLESPKISSFSPDFGEVEKVTGDYGTIYFAKNSELPFVQGTFLLPLSVLEESRDSTGQLSAMAGLMRLGGAGSYSARELDKKLLELSASISTSIGEDFLSVTFTCLTPDFPVVAALARDVLYSPRFDGDRTELWKLQSLESITRRKDDPVTIARIAFNNLLFPKSRLGTVSTRQSVSAVTPKGLKELHRRYVKPRKVTTILAGDVSFEEARKVIQDLLPSQQKKHSPDLVVPRLASPTPQIAFIEKPLAQATVLLGNRDKARDPEESRLLELFNTYYGSGGFGSALMKEVRSRLGLAYSVYGAFSPQRTSGRFVTLTQTKSESALQSIAAIYRIVNELKAGKIDTDGLTDARSSVINSFLFGYDKPGKLASRKAELELLGIPLEHDATYTRKVADVKHEDIKELIKRVDISNSVIVVVGSAEVKRSIEANKRLLPSEIAQLPLIEYRFEESKIVPVKR